MQVKMRAADILLLFFGTTYGSKSCDEPKDCCAALSLELGSEVLVGLNATTNLITPYWAAQAQEMRPGCVVQARSADDVSKAVKTLASGFQAGWDNCRFAVRSGGHAPAANQNNINGGVTIDLVHLDQVTPMTELGVVSVGPGNRWEDVYTYLDRLNLTVVGGRSRTVGVGGLLLSGGMSFFSPRYGLACDTVLNYQIVLSDGQILEANETSHRQLYKALKGGSNNFGVVTRLDLRAVEVPTGHFWGGMASYPVSELSSVLDLTYEFAKSDGYDSHSQLTSLWGFSGNTSLLVTNNHYTKPEAPPMSVFGSFQNLENENTFRIDSMTNFAIELGSINDNGTIRKAFGTVTYKNDHRMLPAFAEASNKTMEALRGVVDQFVISAQPFGNFIMEHSARTGGNSLGLADGEDRVLYCLTIAWEHEADDNTVYGAVRDLLEQTDEFAKGIDSYDEYLFMNYATPWSEVIASYGHQNVADLQATSLKYDPEQIFQKAVPGGFKLFR